MNFQKQLIIMAFIAIASQLQAMGPGDLDRYIEQSRRAQEQRTAELRAQQEQKYQQQQLLEQEKRRAQEDTWRAEEQSRAQKALLEREKQQKQRDADLRIAKERLAQFIQEENNLKDRTEEEVDLEMRKSMARGVIKLLEDGDELGESYQMYLHALKQENFDWSKWEDYKGAFGRWWWYGEADPEFNLAARPEHRQHLERQRSDHVAEFNRQQLRDAHGHMLPN